MSKAKRVLLVHLANFITIFLVIECFLCSFMAVRLYAKKDSLVSIRETAEHAVSDLNTALADSQMQMEGFAEILAASYPMSEEMLATYLENFCYTQCFSAVCWHSQEGDVVFCEKGAHDAAQLGAVPTGQATPYTSEVFSDASTNERFFAQVVSVTKEDGTPLGTLRGFLSVRLLPEFLSAGAYGEGCRFYVVDGTNGRLLSGEKQGILPADLNDFNAVKAEKGYSYAELRMRLQTKQEGAFVFEQNDTSYYAYHVPTGTNTWSLMLVMDEENAFAGYQGIQTTVLVLAICVIVLMLLHVLALMLQTTHTNKRSREGLRRSEYMYTVQRALLNAHNNPDFIERALATVAEETSAETVMLLSLSDKIITHAYFWPSKDAPQAMNMMGRNIREDFPSLFDILVQNKSVVYDEAHPSVELSETAAMLFQNMDICNVVIAPILDNTGVLKGALCAVNAKDPAKSRAEIECVTYDFFMAITNVENHNIIKKMGEMDYLTGVKNRNSYEAALSGYAEMTTERLFCAFIDLNGLHEVNNREGHKAGDRMLCAVADAIKRIYGQEHVYRLGGDEFAVFSGAATQEGFLKRKKRLISELAAEGYFVSVGFESVVKNENGVFDVGAVVSAAEAIMYREKREYYRANGLSTDRGNLPREDTES